MNKNRNRRWWIGVAISLVVIASLWLGWLWPSILSHPGTWQNCLIGTLLVAGCFYFTYWDFHPWKRRK